MMTIKHIDTGGREKVISVVSVSFDPETKRLICHRPNDDVPLTQGKAFLMNDNGKTVSAFILNK